MGGAEGLEFVTVWTHSAPAGLRCPTLACHTAQNVHGRRVERSEVITVWGEKTVNRDLYICININHLEIIGSIIVILIGSYIKTKLKLNKRL